MGLPLIGAGLIGGISGLLGGAEQASANEEMVRQQESFQQQMSDTQYQRGVKDLEAAGLNPILAAGGMQTSSPGGASMPQPNVAASALTGVSTALQAAQTKAQLDNIQADTDKKTQDRMNAQTENYINQLGWMDPTTHEVIPYRAQLYEALRDLNRSQAQLNTAALPGAIMRGSKLGTGFQMLMGSPVGSALRAYMTGGMSSVGGSSEWQRQFLNQ